MGWAVHPHIRGAYCLFRAQPASPVGSSPHTWGIPFDFQWFLGFFRFIPTYVGHTPDRWADNRIIRFIPTYVGHTAWPIPRSQLLRFIPTYVGHTSESFPYSLFQRFIPTYVGHTRPFVQHLPGLHGSSPHTWGIPGFPSQSNDGVRFIPTYVGHTKNAPTRSLHKAVHPHIRGAYSIAQTAARRCGGSSPHTWGIQPRACLGGFDVRFIPTYVGHTLDHRKKNGWFQPLLL